jgi:hypothetical protein
MWMQKGMVERYRKESIANPNSIPAAMAMDAQSDTELCFKRVIEYSY